MAATARPYQICTRTVMDTSDPDIWFDQHGVSSHALQYDQQFAPAVEAAFSGDRRAELDRLIARIKSAGEGKPYDCIIGISGGVDSTYLMLQAVKFGLRPLAVHFDSGWNSELAIENMQRLVETLQLDLVTHAVPEAEMADLQLAFFKASVANCDTPSDHAFPYIANREALRHGVKYILSGYNFASESVLPKAWGYTAADGRQVRGIHRRFGTVPLRQYPVMGLLKRHGYYQFLRGIKVVAPLNYLPYKYAAAKAEISAEVGWQDYGGKHYESIFTRYFQGYYLPKKFGFDKRRAHYSSLILSGQMSREDALAELAKPALPEPLRQADETIICAKLGISTSELDALLAQPPVSHLAYPNEKWLWDLVGGMVRFGKKLKGAR